MEKFDRKQWQLIKEFKTEPAASWSGRPSGPPSGGGLQLLQVELEVLIRSIKKKKKKLSQVELLDICYCLFSFSPLDSFKAVNLFWIL